MNLNVRFFSFLALLLITIGGFSQSKIKVKESHGDPFKQKGKAIDDIFELGSGGFWSITHGYSATFLYLFGGNVKYFVQTYDEKMNMVSEKKLNLKINKKEFELEKIVRFQKDYIVFLTYDNLDKKKKELYYALFDPYYGNIDGEPSKIAEIKIPSKGERMTQGSFDVSVSDNENYLVVFGNDPQKINKKQGFFNRKSSEDKSSEHTFKFTYWVLDTDFEVINFDKKHTLKLENSSDKFYVRDYTVDDNGAIYILGKNEIVESLSRKDRKERDTKKWVDYDQSAFVVQKINPDGSSKIIQTPADALFVDMDMLFDKEGDINLLGLVGEEYSYNLLVTGIYRLKLSNDSLDILTEVIAPFDANVLENVNDVQESMASLNSRKKKRVEKRIDKLSPEKKELMDLRMKAALNANFIAYSGLDENGDAVIILEERHVEVVTTTTTDANGRRTTTTTYYYHYDDLIIAKFIDDDVYQNFYKKSFVSVNVPLRRSMDASLKNGEVNIMTQGQIVRAAGDLSSVADYELKAFNRKDRIPGMRRKMFTYRKTMNEDLILAAAQNGRKLVWYKIAID
jgi:hypothetical protein